MLAIYGPLQLILGVVYFVKSADDVQQLFEQENGLYWTAHPRIKGESQKTNFFEISRDTTRFLSFR